jgi:predicted nucleotidyltransferase component of viral defense system
MHDEILNNVQQSALALLSQISEVQSFYLAGGTALALHLGHRESVDFDFFRQTDFIPQRLLNCLPTPPPLSVLQEERNTLTVMLHNVKISFFAYPHALIRPSLSGPCGFEVADVPDIAAMKLAAIAGRGSRKDFVDVYFISQQCLPLREVFQLLPVKFPAHQYDLYHILRSLTYFADAEAEPIPRMLKPVAWEEIKRFFITEAARLRR